MQCLAHSRDSTKGLWLLPHFKAFTQASKAEVGYKVGPRKAWKVSWGGTGWRWEAELSEVFPEMEPDAPCIPWLEK